MELEGGYIQTYPQHEGVDSSRTHTARSIGRVMYYQVPKGVLEMFTFVVAVEMRCRRRPDLN